MPRTSKKHGARPPQPAPALVDSEPEDATELADMAVDAQPRAEAAQDLATATVDVESINDQMDVDETAVTASMRAQSGADGGAKDTGDLYGVRSPHAGDTDLGAPEHMDAFEGADRGENWMEALSEHATESGPAPEEEIVIIDDSDVESHHATEGGDRPIADKGSGGPGGL